MQSIEAADFRHFGPRWKLRGTVGSWTLLGFKQSPNAEGPSTQTRSTWPQTMQSMYRHVYIYMYIFIHLYMFVCMSLFMYGSPEYYIMVVEPLAFALTSRFEVRALGVTVRSALRESTRVLWPLSCGIRTVLEFICGLGILLPILGTWHLTRASE